MKNDITWGNFDTDTFTQVSTTRAFTEGVLETPLCIGDVKKWCNFGFGSTAGIREGFTVLNNQIYSMSKIDDTKKVCLCYLAFFDDKTDQHMSINIPLSMKDLRNYVDSVLLSRNILYAIRIDGVFEFVKTSLFLKFTKPYPRLTPEIANQASNKVKENLSGTLLCFWLPEYLEPVNNGSGGLHIHFLSDDRTFMGHVIDCRLINGTLSINPIHNLNLILPQNTDEFYNADFTTDRDDMSKRGAQWVQDGMGGKDS